MCRLSPLIINTGIKLSGCNSAVWRSNTPGFTPNNLKQFMIPNFQTLRSKKNLWNYVGKVSKLTGHATYGLKLIMIRSRTTVRLWTLTHRLTKRMTSKRAKHTIWNPNLEKKAKSMLSKDSEKHLSAETYWVYNSDLKLPTVWYEKIQ